MAEFQFKPFNEMTAEDYAEIGFKSGLEVHQQLKTERKLFCRCPCPDIPYSDEYHAEILRHMRPTLSELGEYDGTALMEFKTKKDIIYRINRSNICTYEMDDTPPFEINDQALDIAFKIGMLYNSNIVDEIHIARKQYLDGSIPTGFQRTAITCVGGAIPYKDRMIRITQMSIEEDACREASDIGHTRIYLTDRLGVPLIETVTEPEMKTPTEVAEVNQIIRKLARSTGEVRITSGAGREDVNVSVTGGTRIEIKGVSKIKNIPLLTYNEAMRQWNLLRLRAELAKRGITPETFEAKVDDITKLLKKTNNPQIFHAIEEGKLVYCVTLKGWKDLLRWQTQTDTYFSKEIADRVRVIACLTALPNIINSDTNFDALSSSEGQKIRKTIGATPNDTLVLVWGEERDVITAGKEIIIRAKEATIGIPSETRQALRDGTNGFERILPGADRMYPDTDLPPKRITSERLDRIRTTMPVPFWNIEKEYKAMGIPADTVSPLVFSPMRSLFEKFVKEWNINPTLAAVALIQFPKRLRKQKFNTSKLTAEVIETIFEAHKNNAIPKDGIYSAMKYAVVEDDFSIDTIPELCTQDELKKIINEEIARTKEMKIYNTDNINNLLMGLIMNRVRGLINGAVVASYVQQIMTNKEK